jgi:hypothetical protein
MKKLLAAMFVALLMVGCGDEQQQAVDDPSIPAAIPCMACGKPVSKMTDKCPQCGHPTSDSVVAYKKAEEEERRLAAIKAEKERKWLKNKTAAIEAMSKSLATARIALKAKEEEKQKRLEEEERKRAEEERKRAKPQQDARERIAKMLGKEVKVIKWSSNNPVVEFTYLLKEHLSKEAKKLGIVESSISIPGRSIKDIKAINIDTLRTERPTIKEKEDFDRIWRKKNGNQPPTSAEERGHFAKIHNKIKSDFKEYADKEIAKFKKDDLLKAFAKTVR